MTRLIDVLLFYDAKQNGFFCYKLTPENESRRITVGKAAL